MPSFYVRVTAALAPLLSFVAAACVSEGSNPPAAPRPDASVAPADAGSRLDAAREAEAAAPTIDDSGADMGTLPQPDAGPDAGCATHAAVWTKQVSAAALATLWGLATDGQGNAYITGQFPSSLNFGTTPLTGVGFFDLPLAKVDALGSEVWARSYGSKDQAGAANAQGAVSGQAVAVGTGGDIAVTGFYRLLASFGATTLTTTSVSDLDGFVAAFDATGNARWALRFGDVAQDRGVGVAVDAAGNVFVAGTFQGTIDIGLGRQTSRAGATSTLIAKLNRAGTAQWSKVWNGISVASGGLAIDAAGNVVVAGQATESVDVGGGPTTFGGATDIFVAKLTTNGAHVFSATYGDAAAQRADSVAIDAAGNTVIGGVVAGTVNLGGGALSGSADDLLIAKLDAAGASLWNHRYGSGAYQQANGVAIDASGSVALVGTYTGALDFGAGNLPAAAGPNGAVFVSHFSAAGSLDWAASYVGATSSQGLRTAAAGGGAFVVSGLSEGAIDFCGHALTSTLQLPFVAKLSP